MSWLQACACSGCRKLHVLPLCRVCKSRSAVPCQASPERSPGSFSCSVLAEPDPAAMTLDNEPLYCAEQVLPQSVRSDQARHHAEPRIRETLEHELVVHTRQKTCCCEMIICCLEPTPLGCSATLLSRVHWCQVRHRYAAVHESCFSALQPSIDLRERALCRSRSHRSLRKSSRTTLRK